MNQKKGGKCPLDQEYCRSPEDKKSTNRGAHFVCCNSKRGDFDPGKRGEGCPFPMKEKRIERGNARLRKRKRPPSHKKKKSQDSPRSVSPKWERRFDIFIRRSPIAT